MKLNDFTAVCKMIIVVFLVRLMLAVGNKPTLTHELRECCCAGRAVAGSVKLLAAHPSFAPCCNAPRLERGRYGFADGLGKHHPESPCWDASRGKLGLSCSEQLRNAARLFRNLFFA